MAQHSYCCYSSWESLKKQHWQDRGGKYINNTAKHTKNRLCLAHAQTQAESDSTCSTALFYIWSCKPAKCFFHLLHIKQGVAWKRKCNLDRLQKKKRRGKLKEQSKMHVEDGTKVVWVKVNDIGKAGLIPSAPALKVCVRQLNGTSGCFSAPPTSGLNYKLKTTSSH